MPRRKKTSVADVAKAIATSADPIKAGNRSRLAMKRAGLENIKQAFKLYDISDRFANVYAAVGFASSIAAQPFTTRQINEFETIGRAKLAALGVVEMADDIGDRTEVIVSVPIAQQEGLTALYALGLKRTGISTARGYVELRGAAIVETLNPMVVSLGGKLTIVDRPAMISLDPQNANASLAAELPVVDDSPHEPAKVRRDQPQAEASTQPMPTSAAAIPQSLDTRTQNTDEGAQPPAIPVVNDPSQAKHQDNPDVPTVMGRQELTNAASPATQPKSLPAVTAKAVAEPYRSVRPPYRPPQAHPLPRRSDP